MGVTLSKDLRIAGFRASEIKNALRSINRTHSADAFLELRGSFADRRDGAIAFEECLDRGLVEPGRYGHKLTLAGEAFALASILARTPLARAKAAIDDLIAKIEAYNADKKQIEQVDQVWLFGSAMRGEETVGDIDMALSTSRRARYDQNPERFLKDLDKALSARDDVPLNSGALNFYGERWLMERALFGQRRHPLYKGVQLFTGNLEYLGVPCQLIFDRTRGGRVDDPVVSRHPRSQGRGADVPEPHVMPDLKPAPLRPMDARWVSRYMSSYASPWELIQEWMQQSGALYPDLGANDHLRVVCGDHTDDGWGWTPARLRQGGLDGRERILVSNTNRGTGVSAVLHRQIIEGEEIKLKFRIEDPELKNLRNASSAQRLSTTLGALIALIVATDAERIMRRQLDTSDARPVHILLDTLAGQTAIEELISDEVITNLDLGLIRIAPVGWQGEQPTVRYAFPFDVRMPMPCEEDDAALDETMHL